MKGPDPYTVAIRISQQAQVQNALGVFSSWPGRNSELEIV